MLPGWFGDDESPPRPAAPEGEPMMSITLAAGAWAYVGGQLYAGWPTGRKWKCERKAMRSLGH